MKQILVFGAGKSATVLIDYILGNADAENWHLTLADANLALARQKVGDSSHGTAVSFDINDARQREEHIAVADLVISMLPPALHRLVAADCLAASRSLLTASYVDSEMLALADEIKAKGLLFLCEMGLDPGIDHMSAMQIIDSIRAQGGHITSFRSHCGGLVAPESDDNPWHYKISWNPRNIVLAGKAGAHYRENGKDVHLAYEQLFATQRLVDIPGLGNLSWYPNRDSLSYEKLYGLDATNTFVRTTLRHPEFISGWNNIVTLGLTDETPAYESKGRSLAELFAEHVEKHGHQEFLEKMSARNRQMLNGLVELMKAEKKLADTGDEPPSSYMSADSEGRLEEIDINAVKDQVATSLAVNIRESNLALTQLEYLGLYDRETSVDIGFCSAADILQQAAETKLALQPNDRDMIVMLHEFAYEQDGKNKSVSSSLVVKGQDSLRTAMAATVGLPLAIAARLILRGEITRTGLCIPTTTDIYEPVLKELEQYGVRFEEKSE